MPIQVEIAYHMVGWHAPTHTYILAHIYMYIYTCTYIPVHIYAYIYRFVLISYPANLLWVIIEGPGTYHPWSSQLQQSHLSGQPARGQRSAGLFNNTRLQQLPRGPRSELPDYILRLSTPVITTPELFWFSTFIIVVTYCIDFYCKISVEDYNSQCAL